MNPEQIKQEQERVNKLLEGITEGDWISPWDLPDANPENVAMNQIQSSTGELVVGTIEHDAWPYFAVTEENARLIIQAPTLARAYLALLDAHLALHAQLAQAGERERLRALGAELKAGELETERLKAEIDHAWEALEAHRDSTGHLFTTPVTESLHLAALEAEAAISRHYDHLRVIRREITAAVKALTTQEAHNE